MGDKCQEEHNWGKWYRIENERYAGISCYYIIMRELRQCADCGKSQARNIEQLAGKEAKG